MNIERPNAPWQRGQHHTPRFNTETMIAQAAHHVNTTDSSRTTLATTAQLANTANPTPMVMARRLRNDATNRKAS